MRGGGFLFAKMVGGEKKGLKKKNGGERPVNVGGGFGFCLPPVSSKTQGKGWGMKRGGGGGELRTQKKGWTQGHSFFLVQGLFYGGDQKMWVAACECGGGGKKRGGGGREEKKMKGGGGGWFFVF